MGEGWSENDKAVAKAASERARKRACDEAIALHSRYTIDTIEDLWRLEQLIGQWRKERVSFGHFSYENANETFALWLARGWLQLSDLGRMSPERLADIVVKAERMPRPLSTRPQHTGKA
jgi:hypothetical protein